MRELRKTWSERWKLNDLLRDQPGLRLKPSPNGRVQLAGVLGFSAEKPGLERIEDAFQVEIAVPAGFPKELPVVKEVGGRIPDNYHRNSDGGLCLGSPTQQLLAFVSTPTLPSFVERCVIPYLYGFVYQARHGKMPFGELSHGMKGIRQDYVGLFGVDSESAAIEMVYLTSLKKRAANKRPCPCGSGKRLGKCHNRKVNHLRSQLGRKWFAAEYRWLKGS